jgi:predicted branched-subunit amino acid permease
MSFVKGLHAGVSLPPLLVLLGMIGYASLAKSLDFSLIETVLGAAGIYGLPGQVALLELYASGASALAVIIAASMANMRFLPMAISLMPIFERSGSFYKWRYIIIHLMSVNSWSYVLQNYPTITASQRFAFFCGFGAMCFSCGIAGTILGWTMAGSLPTEITLTLIFLNPAYFVFLFCANRNRNVLISLAIGAVLGPLFHLITPEWGIPLCGLVAGSAGFWLDKKTKAGAVGVSGASES